MSKPLIEVKSVNADGVFTRITLDFDAIFGMSPHQSKVRLEAGPQVINGAILMFKNGKEMFVTNSYEELSDQWIKLTHPCVNTSYKCGKCGFSCVDS
jgi:hypothetical protein